MRQPAAWRECSINQHVITGITRFWFPDLLRTITSLANLTCDKSAPTAPSCNKNSLLFHSSLCCSTNVRTNELIEATENFHRNCTQIVDLLHLPKNLEYRPFAESEFIVDISKNVKRKLKISKNYRWTGNFEIVRNSVLNLQIWILKIRTDVQWYISKRFIFKQDSLQLMTNNVR